MTQNRRVAIVGPVYPYRAGIAYCTTRLAEELGRTAEVSIVSFRRQYPKRFYPGGDDTDATLRDRIPPNASFELDVVNPLTWVRAGLRLRKYDAVVFVWWIWVWAPAYVVMLALMRRGTAAILQCHNISDKEPAWWKSWLTNRVLRRGDALVVHAETELLEAVRRAGGRRAVKAHLPVHEMGGAVPSRDEARSRLNVTARNVALFFGHVRPYKGLDIALKAWRTLRSDVLLLVAGEVWWHAGDEYRRLADGLKNVRFDFRFIPDAEIATYFAAADVVLVPYRHETQSGVALTAFHFGRPVIATRVGGLPEVVRDGVNGSLVSPEDPVALAAAVDAFFMSADRPALEQGALETARAYSWEDYSKVISGLVESSS